MASAIKPRGSAQISKKKKKVRGEERKGIPRRKQRETKAKLRRQMEPVDLMVVVKLGRSVKRSRRK